MPNTPSPSNTRSISCALALSGALAGGLAVSLCSAMASASSPEPVLMFADEFDGPEIDTDIWQFQIGTGQFGWGNNELQYYTDRPENARIVDGKLVITARNDGYQVPNGGNVTYTSTRMRSINGINFRYGRVEGRIKLPSTEGIWPAFWMMPTDSVYGVWAASGELDIMESVNQADRIYGTTHFGGTWPANTSNGDSFSDGTDFSQDFHVYAVEWTPQLIKWYVDDRLYHRMVFNEWFSANDPDNPLAPFDQFFHLILNVAVGGNFPGYPDASSVFPQTMEVDWVRVYELEQSPFGDGPISLPGSFEAEDFDNGFNGHSYLDRSLVNSGGAYRTDADVDIVASTGGGHHITGIRSNEWLEYTVDVATAGTYEMRARLASLTNACLVELELDGESLTGQMFILPTGGDEAWTTLTAEVELPAGEHVLRWVTITDDQPQYSLDRFEFVALDSACPADWNGDGSANVLDVIAFITEWNQGTLDYNGDGGVNIIDIITFITVWNDGCP